MTVGADDSVDEAMSTMNPHQIRRLPVIDGRDLIGIVSMANLAKNLDDDKLGDLVEAVSA